MEYAMIGLTILSVVFRCIAWICKYMIYFGLGWFIPFLLLSLLEGDIPHTFTLWVGILGTGSTYVNKIGRLVTRDRIWTWWSAVINLIF